MHSPFQVFFLVCVLGSGLMQGTFASATFNTYLVTVVLFTFSLDEITQSFYISSS